MKTSLRLLRRPLSGRALLSTSKVTNNNVICNSSSSLRIPFSMGLGSRNFHSNNYLKISSSLPSTFCRLNKSFSTIQNHKNSFSTQTSTDANNTNANPTSNVNMNKLVDDMPLKLDPKLPIPEYLEETYWWAYVREGAVKFWDRKYFGHPLLINAILFGNMNKLIRAALDSFGSKIDGRTLQVTCVYGELLPRLAERVAKGSDSRLDIIDVAPEQLKNARRKLFKYDNVFLHHQNSNQLKFEDESFDNTLVFFLMHEQPDEVRRKTIKESMRVTKKGGKIVFVDYHQPYRINPFRYLMIPVLKILEPFAMDIWWNEIVDWFPEDAKPSSWKKDTYFGGLYQKVEMIK